MLLLTESDIRKVFEMKDGIESNKNAYAYFSEGKAKVPQREIVHDDEEGSDFIFMPADVSSIKVAGIKIVTSFPKNADKGKETTKGQVLLMDGEEGEFLAMMDGTFVTKFRTAAATGVGFDLFAKKDSKIGAQIGTGGQAMEQLSAMLTACPNLGEIRVAARDFAKTKKFVEAANERFNPDFKCRIVAVEKADDAVKDADVITAVTVSHEPLFKASSVKKGATISAVGSYRYEMVELDPELVKSADLIVCDSVDACLAETGDLIKPIEQNLICKDDLKGDIGEYVLGKRNGRENDDQIIIFKHVGIGVLDLVTAADIYKAAAKAGVGTVWEA